MTKRLVMGLGIAAVAAVVLTSVWAQGKGEVIIATFGGSFGDAQRAAYFVPFEKETGIKVTVVCCPDLAKQRAMVAAGRTEWDVVWNSSIRYVGLQECCMEPVDYGVFDKETRENIFPEAQRPLGIGAIYYSRVLAYSTKKYGKGDHPKNWAEFWDVKRFPGPRALTAMSVADAPLEFALLADGVPPEKLYPLDVERAFGKLTELKKTGAVVKWPTEPDAASQLLNSGEVILADGLQARLQNQIDQGAPIGIEWNQGMMTIDFWTVARGAPNKANAMKFLAFATRAENQARFFSVIPYGPTNKRTLSLLKPERLKDLPTAVGTREKHFFRDATWWAQKGASGRTNIELVNERWTSWVLE